MSLEAAIKENTEAVKALTAALACKPAAHAAEIAASATAPAVTLTYNDIKLPFLELVKTKGRDAALAAIAPNKSLKEVEDKPHFFPGLLAAIQKAAA